MGVCAKHPDIERSVWENAIKAVVPEKFLDINLKAFDLGYSHE